MPRLRLLLAVLPFAAGCALCDQLSATRVVAGTLLFVPEIDDTAIPGVEGKAKNQLKVFYGDRPDDGSNKPVPLPGASVRLIYPLAPEGLLLDEEIVLRDDPDVAPEDKNPNAKEGVYVLNLARAGVELLPGEEYRVEVRDGGEVYEMAVTAPSGPAELEPVHTDAKPHGVKQPLALPHPGKDRLAFVAVRWAPDPERPQCDSPPKSETYSSIPKSANDALDLADNDQRWRQDPIQVPPAAFPTCGIYTVVVAGMARGTTITGNLFIGSQLLAGRATGQVYRVE